MEPKQDWNNTSNDSSKTEQRRELPYKELIGALLYISQRTRPDISFAVNKLSQFCACYGEKQWIAAKRVLRYLKSTQSFGIVYERTGKSLIAFSDADWANDPRDRKSISGFVVFLANGPVSWSATKQNLVTLSTMEAEYVALSQCVKEVAWLRELLSELQMEHSLENATDIMCDNQACISHANNPIESSRTKHVAIKFHYVREKVNDGVVQLLYMPTEDNIADIFTKPLGKTLFEKHRSKIVE